MKKLLAIFLLSYSFVAQAQSNHLVISQVYGGGGNTGALYKYDYIELYNPTSSAVSLSGWSLQYAGVGTNNWKSNKTNLSGTIAPGNYFLVRCGNAGTEGGALPAPDLLGTQISIATTGGKIALKNDTVTLKINKPLPDATIIDFVGFGGADTAETAPATGPVSSNTTSSVTRVNNGCTDADNNSADFVLATASPRNSTSNGNTCNGTTISVGAIAPNPFCIDANNSASGTVNYTANGTFSNSTFKVVLSDANGSFGFSTIVGSTTISATNPSGAITITIPATTASGTGYRMRIEATNPALLSANQSAAVEIINGAKNLLQNEFSSAANNTTETLNWTNPTGCFDEILIVAKAGSAINGTPAGDGSAYTADLNFAGSGTPFDGGKVVYKGTTSGQTVTNLTNGTTYFFKAFTRRGSNWSSGTEISDKPRVVPLAGEIVINQFSPGYNAATDEYYELVNLTDKPFDLSDVAIRIVNSTGATVVAGGSLNGTIQPHSFWLASPNATITTGQTTALARDNNVDGGIAATNNQIGLVRKTDNTLLDAVSYGTITTPTYTEGNPTPNPPSKGGLKRIISGADANNNATDFVTVANTNIALHNSNSRLANTNATIPAGSYATLEVTGSSALAGTATATDSVLLTNGIFALNTYNLTTAKINTGTAAKYIKTNDIGSLAITNITTIATFPVGNSTYNPVTISNSDGLTWSVTVADSIVPNAAFNRHYAVQRTWTITPSAAPASGATVVFEYDDNDASQLGSSFDKAKQVQVWSAHNGVWQPVTTPQTPVTTASGRKAVTLSNYLLFSPFVIVNINAPLPVHFINFTIRVKNDGVELRFTNAAEKKVHHYAIERGTDGQLFQNLIQLPPQRNDGSGVTYRWLDAAPPAGDVWYRVKGVDEDGVVRVTPALKINVHNDMQGLMLYPNPVRDHNIIWQTTLPKGVYQLQVRNSAGQTVLQQRWEHSGGTCTQTLPLPAQLPPGVYSLQIVNRDWVRQQSFVVQ